MAESDQFAHTELDLPNGKISYLRGGDGPSLICLHHSWGNPGSLDLHQKLADNFTVLIPDMPGWGGSERPLWARTVRDIAILVSHFANQVADAPYHLVGFGFGGYVAAEIASMSETTIANLVLVGAVGIQPRDGEIMDQMMYSHRQYIEESFRDRESYVNHFGEEPAQEMRELWDHSREMTARVTWKPYMFNRRLAELLKNVAVRTSLIWGEHDKVVPIDVAEQYQEALKNSQIHIVNNAGHVAEIEAPDEVQALIASHCGTQLDQVSHGG
ncbi:MAG: alpha/beta hydrolase [Gammaproteobacteria bacterium]|nr:alpha/beta hydrolase [Gammaproteobacteria bacterium]